MAKGIIENLKHLYNTKYKELLIIPILMFVFSLVVIGNTYLQTGEFVKKSVSLKGGSTIAISNQNIETDELKSYLTSKFPDLDLSVRSLTTAGRQTGIIVEASTENYEPILNEIEYKIGKLKKDDYSIDTTGSSLGKSFFKQAIIALIIAFIAMAIVVFITFKKFLPSLYIIISAVADILFALAIFNLFNLKLTTAGIAAFLMLIGYSVDTDILLTTRVLKRKEGNINERILASLSTGMTMTIAAIISVVVAYFATNSEVLKQIMFILFWGLFADIFNTWITNVSLLRIYLEKEREHEH